MFTLSGSPGTTSQSDIYILSILHYLRSPLGLCTLILDLIHFIELSGCQLSSLVFRNI